jgi:hypothetical protein
MPGFNFCLYKYKKPYASIDAEAGAAPLFEKNKKKILTC